MKRRIDIYLKNKDKPIVITDTSDSTREEYREEISKLFSDPNMIIGEFEMVDIIARPSEISFIQINNDTGKETEQKTINIDTTEDIITDIDWGELWQ